MKWLVKVIRQKEDPFTHHISVSTRHYEYRSEKTARKKIQDTIESSPYVTCELYEQIPGTFKQEQLFGPQSSLWDF